MTVYNFLERPNRLARYTYHLPVFVLIATCSILSVLYTIHDYKDVVQLPLYYLEILVMTQLTTEYILRIWSCGCRSRYQGIRGRLMFARRFFCVLDMIIVTGSILIINFRNHENRELNEEEQVDIFIPTILRLLRFLQIIRIIRVDRRANSWKLLASVIKDHSRELLSTWYIGLIMVIFGSYVIYMVESNLSKDCNINECSELEEKHENQFRTYVDALWWGMVSLTTIGYGQVIPQSGLGRFIASIFCMFGISFFALPAGILGTGFAFKVQEQQRQKHFTRRRLPAATLIQRSWRVFATSPSNTHLTASWFIFRTKLINIKRMNEMLDKRNENLTIIEF